MPLFSSSIKPGCSNLRYYAIAKDIGFINDAKNRSVIKLNDRTGKKSGRKSDENKKFKKSSLLLLALPGVAFGLGCWQVQRLRWKLNYIEELEKKLETAVSDFPIHDLNNLDNYEYKKVHLKGRFLFEKEFVIVPRGRFDKDYKQKSSGLAGDSDSSSHGGHVITPFALDKSDLIIMVNRGWLPTTQLRNRPIPKEHVGVIELDGIIRKSEDRPTFVSENIPEKGIWFYKNFKQMAKICGTSPIYVEATSDFTKPGGPIAGQTNINVRNEHFQYLATWFTLSAITSAMWYIKFVK